MMRISDVVLKDAMKILAVNNQIAMVKKIVLKKSIQIGTNLVSLLNSIVDQEYAKTSSPLINHAQKASQQVILISTSLEMRPL
jgi:hypothetical protein